MKNTLFVARVQRSQRRARGDATMRDPSKTSAGAHSLRSPHSHFSPSLQPFDPPPLPVTSSSPSSEGRPIYTKTHFELAPILFFFFTPLPLFINFRFEGLLTCEWSPRAEPNGTGGRDGLAHGGERFWTDFL